MRIAVLQAYDERVDGLGEEYPTDLERIMERARGTSLRFECFDLPRGEMPLEPSKFSGFIITGSPASVNTPSLFLPKLVEFVRYCDEIKKRVFGICYGHQVLAYSFGGRVGPMKVSWNLGLRKYSIQSTFFATASRCYLDWNCAHYGMHNEQILELPQGFQCLGSVRNCKTAIMAKGYHFLSTQMHPELDQKGFEDINTMDPHVPGALASHDAAVFEDNLGSVLCKFFISD